MLNEETQEVEPLTVKDVVVIVVITVVITATAVTVVETADRLMDKHYPSRLARKFAELKKNKEK